MSQTAAPIKMPAIQTEDLQFHYDSLHALKNINLKIERKQITALIGPSGCGKSTFLRTLNRMNDLIPGIRTEGGIWIDGVNITDRSTDPVDLRKKVGMVFQHASVFPGSIYENIAFGPRIHGVKSKRALDDLVESNLRSAALWEEVKDQLGKPAAGLSGGQQQRLTIARTLATKPDIILMDEPTSALDPISTAKVEELIKSLKEQYTIVIVTHNMQQAARISDFTAFFLNGEVKEFGSTEAVFSRPAHQETKDYIAGKFG
ncbi:MULTISPECIES: phosphate ABC transporter ATP-binding protein PstB [unclassified Sporosarcina]|uniref:phosphate ABC transporter ATP-binding protein PstB n=1 Tax=unclassified Sporosarcina TaxID=2647733 RepID=UPI0020807983|nr:MULTISPECIES: phosphate ABC transporter ATP-binding protein PstB [unclassified Sporosarcina]GKV66453.1 phosphate import ATP-binding protein PstB 1 [Sporosarcina sp. NCCP-2331]GLB56683.1 phosphate import ATP-binding protein PstB 1 [Sporosarcina sp. NCCP-2378]